MLRRSSNVSTQKHASWRPWCKRNAQSLRELSRLPGRYNRPLRRP
jgi:hypothetical protein